MDGSDVFILFCVFLEQTLLFIVTTISCLNGHKIFHLFFFTPKAFLLPDTKSQRYSILKAVPRLHSDHKNYFRSFKGLQYKKYMYILQ
jgi:hypothetical protein